MSSVGTADFEPAANVSSAGSPLRTSPIKPRFTHRAGSTTVARVPKSARSTAAAVSPDVSFEEALKKLEAIVGEMESDTLPLEDLIKHYEQGTQLAAVCQKKLAEAGLKIQKLEKNAAGEFELKPFPLEDDEAAEQDPA